MQKNDMALKRRYLYDGNEIPGLVESSAIKDEEGVIEVPSFNRKKPLKDGVKMFAPLELTYKVQRDSRVQKFFYDWFNKNEYHDVTVIETDATGAEVNRLLLRDCENALYDEREYNAGAIDYFGLRVRIICTSDPVNLLGA